jgi:ABC-type nitrate/sulfonate/bicarbonate transport system permease component
MRQIVSSSPACAISFAGTIPFKPGVRMLEREWRMMRASVAALRATVLHAYPLLLLLLLWEGVAHAGLLRPLFLPGPGVVAHQLWLLLGAGEIVAPLGVSLYRAFAGLALAVIAGVLGGLCMARSRWASWALDPLVSIAFPAPKIAFVPIFILWFGIDDLSKILLVAFTCVFPMIIATYHGATAVPRTVIWSAQAMGTTQRRLLIRIILPAALPYVFTGARVTLPVSLITAFTAEMIAGGGGVGSALMFAQRFFQTPTVFAYILLMLAAGLVLDRLMLCLRSSLLPWDEGQQEG